MAKERRIKDKNKKGRKKNSLFSMFRYSISFIIFEVVFTGVVMTLVVFYGPFINVKKTVVGALMTSGAHQYIAKWFLSDAEINNLVGTATANSQVTQATQKVNLNAITIAHKNDTGIVRYDVSSTNGKFKGYMLLIKDPTRVKVGVSKSMGVEGELTSQIAKDNNAVAAINAGGFVDTSTNGTTTYTGTGGIPAGILISNGNVISNNDGNLDKKVTTMGITNAGKLLVGNYSVNDLESLNVTQAVSFMPILVLNGHAVKITEDGGIAPRTAIGQTADGSILLLVIDGRQLSSLGATYQDVQNIMLQYGAVNAINLDGGSSSTMYYDGSIINNPCDSNGERYVPSAVYVGN